MRVTTVAIACVAALLASCVRRPKPVRPKPLEVVRYLPSPQSPCVRRPPPSEPPPPKCTDPSIPTSCSADELDEWTATLLDHREALASWSALTWRVCGPVTP